MVLVIQHVSVVYEIKSSCKFLQTIFCWNIILFMLLWNLGLLFSEGIISLII
jgi:hypothetical protein